MQEEYMKRFYLVWLIVMICFGSIGCFKKETPLELLTRQFTGEAKKTKPDIEKLKTMAGTTDFCPAQILVKTNKLDNIAIQGELCGPGIQSNPLQLKEFNIFFFNVYDIKEGKYKDVVELTNMCVLLRLNMVPIIERHYKLNNDVQALVTYATRKSVYNPNVWLEGIVIRPIEEIEDREFMNVLNYNRVSFKVINPEYLICNDG
jgi:hypothetical protein